MFQLGCVTLDATIRLRISYAYGIGFTGPFLLEQEGDRIALAVSRNHQLGENSWMNTTGMENIRLTLFTLGLSVDSPRLLITNASVTGYFLIDGAERRIPGA